MYSKYCVFPSVSSFPFSLLPFSHSLHPFLPLLLPPSPTSPSLLSSIPKGLSSALSDASPKVASQAIYAILRWVSALTLTPHSHSLQALTPLCRLFALCSYPHHFSIFLFSHFILCMIPIFFLSSLFVNYFSSHFILVFLYTFLFSPSPVLPRISPSSLHSPLSLSLAEACSGEKDFKTNVLSQFMPFLLEKLLAVTNR